MGSAESPRVSPSHKGTGVTPRPSSTRFMSPYCHHPALIPCDDRRARVRGPFYMNPRKNPRTLLEEGAG